jgi:hypothetical protein
MRVLILRDTPERHAPPGAARWKPSRHRHSIHCRERALTLVASTGAFFLRARPKEVKTRTASGLVSVAEDSYAIWLGRFKSLPAASGCQRLDFENAQLILWMVGKSGCPNIC